MYIWGKIENPRKGWTNRIAVLHFGRYAVGLYTSFCWGITSIGLHCGFISFYRCK